MVQHMFLFQDYLMPVSKSNQLHTLFQLSWFYWKLIPVHVSGVTCPTSGGPPHMLLGVIACVRCALAACESAFYANSQAVNTHLAYAITPISICAGPP
jgi:hypothetical protein